MNYRFRCGKRALWTMMPREQSLRVQLQPRFSPLMSLADERGSETDNSERISRLAARSIPPLRHRQRDFGHGNVDASDGAGLRYEPANEQGALVRYGEFRRR